jgi:hypothetical protein
MTAAATKPRVFLEAARRQSCKICRLWFVLVLVILAAIQVVLVTGAWEYPYARLLIPDVIRTDSGGLAFPPQVTVRNHDIVDSGVSRRIIPSFLCCKGLRVSSPVAKSASEFCLDGGGAGGDPLPMGHGHGEVDRGGHAVCGGDGGRIRATPAGDQG